MRNELKQHLLRTMLLESDDGAKTLADIRNFIKYPTEEKKQDLIQNLRKNISEKAKELLTIEQIEHLISEIPPSI